MRFRARLHYFLIFFILVAIVPVRADSIVSQGPCDVQLLSDHSGEEIAKSAGLHYLQSYSPGISRFFENTDAGQIVLYHDPSGNLITDPDELARIKSLRIPVVYQNVWISPDPLSHIQATAIDSKRRTQYRYHPRWIQAKAAIKFSRMVEFGNALPEIHEEELRNLAESQMSKDKVLAAIAWVMEKTAIRVGSDDYARDNGTYGLTTFLKTHVTINGNRITFHFIGKSSVEHLIDLEDEKVGPVIHDLLLEPGEKLFQYLGDDGKPHSISAAMLNNYLEEVSGGHFTAKDFRTWIGTVTATETLLAKPIAGSDKDVEANILAAVDAAADRLGNSRSVARKNYIEPAIFEAYRDRARFEQAKQQLLTELADSRPLAERLVLLLLK
jgi:DNA topoisomerase I